MIVGYTGIPFTVGEGIGSCSRTDVFDSTIVGSSIGVSTEDWQPSSCLLDFSTQLPDPYVQAVADALSVGQDAVNVVQNALGSTPAGGACQELNNALSEAQFAKDLGSLVADLKLPVLPSLSTGCVSHEFVWNSSAPLPGDTQVEVQVEPHVDARVLGGVALNSLTGLTTVCVEPDSATVGTACQSVGPMPASTFLSIWQNVGAAELSGCTGPLAAGLALNNPADPGTTTSSAIDQSEVGCGWEASGRVTYVWLHEGTSVSYTVDVPAGASERLEYGIPAGEALNNAPARITGVQPETTVCDGGSASSECSSLPAFHATAPANTILWTSEPLAPGTHTVTITSAGDAVNVYGLWLVSG